MKKQLTVEDFTMILQWVATVALTPLILLPLFPRQPVSFTMRLIVVIGAWLMGVVMTLIYLRMRKSRRAAVQIVNITATLDVVLVVTALFIWPKYIPDLFWIFPLLVIVVAARFSYRETAAVTLALSALYAITIIARLGTAPTRTVIGDTIFRIIFLMMIAMCTVYLSNREKRERRDAKILSGVAAAIGSTLDFDELIQAVVEGISEASGLGRCSAYFTSQDGRWAVPKASTEKTPELYDKFFEREIDLKKENVASRVVTTRQPLVVTDVADSTLLDRRWISDFSITALLVIPIIVRDEAIGVVFVERRGLKKFFNEREIDFCNSILAQASAGLENAMRYAEEQLKRSESDILYRTSRELGSTLEIEQVAENACKLAIGSTGSTGCTAFLADESGGRMVPRVSVGPGGARRLEFPQGSEMTVAEMDHVYSLAGRPPALAISRPGESSLLPPFLRAEGVVLLVPFYSHGRISGILVVSDGEGREFSESQMSQLAAVAGEAALALENARLHERIKSDATQLSSLIQLANAIGSTADLTTIMSIAMDTVRHMFDCTSGLIYRLNDKDRTMRYVDSFGYPEETIGRISSPPYQSVNDCWTVVEGRLIGVDDLSRTQVACKTLEKIGEGSTICVGIVAEGQTLGVLHVRSERPDAFTEEDQQLALAIADQVALALQRAILFEEINRLAITDPLTGVYNVRRLESVLRDEVSRARRYDRPVSFLMVDVDNLKSYNDTLGHQKGDVVLSQVASIIDNSTRDVDKVFRYGGDEFCVLLPETDARDAVVVAEKVRRAVSEFHFPGEERIPGECITVSAGVASFPGDTDDEEDLIRKADLALYAVKQKGRNSVAAAG